MHAWAKSLLRGFDKAEEQSCMLKMLTMIGLLHFFDHSPSGPNGVYIDIILHCENELANSKVLVRKGGKNKGGVTIW